MRRIEHTTAFRRDFKRERRGRHRGRLNALLTWVVGLLVEDRELPARLRDHALAGQWADFRDCHLAPDLVLIYRKGDAGALQLVRLGSHSELFGR
jgi:mRNA interferase YafQ